MSISQSVSIESIEAARSQILAQVNRTFDALVGQISPSVPPQPITYKQPTPTDGLDPRNKNGNNLTDRGAEILYRVFDVGGGYNRAAKMLNITQGAAKNRKGIYIKQGGINRIRLSLDIDVAE